MTSKILSHLTLLQHNLRASGILNAHPTHKQPTIHLENRILW